jgi:hypothetical protein
MNQEPLISKNPQKFCAFTLAKLSMHPGLTNWERSFVYNVSKRRRFSARDKKIFDLLVAKYLEKKTR